MIFFFCLTHADLDVFDFQRRYTNLSSDAIRILKTDPSQSCSLLEDEFPEFSILFLEFLRI